MTSHADILREIIERIRSEVLVPLEHHVLEHVRETAPAGRIVFGTDVIPNLHRHDGRVVILDRINFETVREREILSSIGGTVTRLAAGASSPRSKVSGETARRVRAATESFPKSPIP
jgi:hypothetical protein